MLCVAGFALRRLQTSKPLILGIMISSKRSRAQVLHLAQSLFAVSRRCDRVFGTAQVGFEKLEPLRVVFGDENTRGIGVCHETISRAKCYARR